MNSLSTRFSLFLSHFGVVCSILFVIVFISRSFIARQDALEITKIQSSIEDAQNIHTPVDSLYYSKVLKAKAKF